MNKYCTLYKDNNTQSKFKINSLNNDFKNKQVKRNDIKNTAGKNWFNMKATEMTPEIENDLKALKLRHIIDPSRFYKKRSQSSFYYDVEYWKRNQRAI